MRSLSAARSPDYHCGVIQPEDPVSPRAPQPPVPNSYWVEPGRLLAGEYPGSSSRAEALDRIQRLLRAGINTFIDLTEEGELPPYLPLLPADAQARIEHHRWPIVDHGLPRSQQYMAEILDSIEDALARQRRVYVHCHAGIGRTGTTIGCYLARSGLTPEGAMEQLQQLWQQSARSKTWPSIPETDDQRTFVREWTEPESGAGTPQLNQARRHEGALLGLAVGDAFGTLLTDGRYDRSRMAPERFPRDLILGPGADTEMTLAAVVSLLSRGGHDAADQMQRYLQALRSNPGATWSADFKRAIAAWQWSRKTNAGSYDPKNLDPHTLARCAAAALYRHDDAAAAVELAVDISRPTQQSPVVLDTCRFWT
ncbi:MAG TPA: ADP-ribosylglycohydrolase family protein, partial [Povalibacter sp.]|nr:ADP-ribosylglycohydrolase family protein [Povalibacter sp.]